jgi:hypothetical protein
VQVKLRQAIIALAGAVHCLERGGAEPGIPGVFVDIETGAEAHERGCRETSDKDDCDEVQQDEETVCHVVF